MTDPEPDQLPPVITDPEHFADGYIYLPRWSDFQHRDAVRTGPPMRWLKQHVDQLDNDAYRELSPSARALLHDLRMVVARTGHGRCTARAHALHGMIGWPAGHVQRNLIPLVHAGFVVVRAGKLPAAPAAAAGTEESRERVAPTAHTRRADARAGEPRRTARNTDTRNGSDPVADAYTRTQLELARRAADIPADLTAGIKPDLVAAILTGYRPGELSDERIDAIQAAANEEPL